MTTKKEFIAKILEVGKGEQIDTSRMAPGPFPGKWVCSDSGDLFYFSYEYMIAITEIDRKNPPNSEHQIGFVNRDTRIDYDELPTPLANHSVRKLYGLPDKAESESVVLPYSFKQALHGLQQDEAEIEWGGGGGISS